MNAVAKVVKVDSQKTFGNHNNKERENERKRAKAIVDKYNSEFSFFIKMGVVPSVSFNG